MENSGFDPSVIVLIVLAVGFAALVIAVVARMAKKKSGASMAESGRGRKPSRDDETDDDDQTTKPEIRRGRAPDPVRKPGPSQIVPEKSVDKAPGKAAPVPEPQPAKFRVDLEQAKHMHQGLARTRQEGFIARLADTFGRTAAIDETIIAGAEEALLTADMGVRTAVELTEALKSDFQPGAGPLAQQVMTYLKEKTFDMIKDQPHGMPALDAPGLNVVMVVGVNGTGKTTNIAKLANYYRNQGRKVILAAGDTFRAAGADQLGIWGERIDIPVVVGKPGQDPSALFFDAARRASEEGFDVMIADTAGRLHTDVNLVDELKKVSRVIGKAVPGAPHQVLLMLDATMGQNAVRQADVFLKSVQVTGIGLSKLDGTARGGVVISIARDMSLPIWFVGVGETVNDIRPFEPGEFVDALFAAD